MKLYYSPGACSMSPNIVAHEAGIKIDLEKVDLASKKTETGADFKAINPKGSVPCLQLDNGQVLTEGPAIVQYLADLAPNSKLAPANGTFERVRLQETLNYITSELHKAMGGLFNKKMPEDFRAVVKDMIAARCDFISTQLKGKQFLMGDQFTVADAYLFTVLGWAPMVGVDLSKWTEITGYQARVAARPAVQEAMKSEGLLNKAA